jgi:acid stress chaperone HdeB
MLRNVRDPAAAVPVAIDRKAIHRTVTIQQYRKDIPMKAIVVAALIAGFSTVQGVAAPIDLSAQTCKQFQASSPDEIKIILAWLDGYYKDEKDPPVIDTDKFVSNAKKLGEYCSANPTIGLITATDKLFGDGK